MTRDLRRYRRREAVIGGLEAVEKLFPKRGKRYLSG